MCFQWHFKLECTVYPTSNNKAAIPEDATVNATSPFGRTYNNNVLLTKVFPVPGPSIKNNLPYPFPTGSITKIFAFDRSSFLICYFLLLQSTHHNFWEFNQKLFEWFLYHSIILGEISQKFMLISNNS